MNTIINVEVLSKDNEVKDILNAELQCHHHGMGYILKHDTLLREFTEAKRKESRKKDYCTIICYKKVIIKDVNFFSNTYYIIRKFVVFQNYAKCN